MFYDLFWSLVNSIRFITPHEGGPLPSGSEDALSLAETLRLSEGIVRATLPFVSMALRHHSSLTVSYFTPYHWLECYDVTKLQQTETCDWPQTRDVFTGTLRLRAPHVSKTVGRYALDCLVYGSIYKRICKRPRLYSDNKWKYLHVTL